MEPSRADRLVAACVRAATRRARAVLAATLALAALSLVYAGLRLGVNADPQALLDADLPFQQLDREFAKHFPVLSNALLVVVDGETGEQARSAAAELAERLRGRRERFTEVYVPGTGPFFERNALLYRTPAELEDFTDHLARVQPILGELSAAPNLPTLGRVLSLGLDAAATDPEAAAQLAGVLEHLGRAALSVYAERPLFVSWEGALLAGSSFDPSHRAVIVAQPVLDYSRILAAGPAIDAIRGDAAALRIGPERGLRVRVTGYPALNHDEMLGLVWDVGLSGVLSFVLVLALLYAALRSLPLVVAAASTLLVGLALTAGFATLAVGSVNLVSIAFAVMFIGLGVDYAIHLGLHYVEERRGGRGHEAGMEGAAAEVGEALLLCTGTTAIGFLAFVPTDYRGVGELGLISAGGMLVILALTLSFFPALLATWCRVESMPALPEDRRRARATRWIEGHPGLVAALALLVGGGGALLAPRVRFDSNVVEMRNPDTESVRAFNDLLADSNTSPWYIDVLEPSLEAAEALLGEARSPPRGGARRDPARLRARRPGGEARDPRRRRLPPRSAARRRRRGASDPGAEPRGAAQAGGGPRRRVGAELQLAPRAERPIAARRARAAREAHRDVPRLGGGPGALRGPRARTAPGAPRPAPPPPRARRR